MKQRLFAAVAIVAVVVGVWAAYSIRSSGQQPTPAVQRSSVNVVRVKPDMIDAWIDFQAKQTVPALKKAGVAQRDVYQAAYGPQGEFRVVTPIGKFADRDNPSPIERALGAAGAKEYNDALRKMTRGLYGLCETCGQPIMKARLEALPYARQCMACKTGGLSRR